MTVTPSGSTSGTLSDSAGGTVNSSTAIPPLAGLDGVVGAPPLAWLHVRRLGPDDKAALTRHFLGLPEADRCTRFGGPLSDAAIRRHCETLDLVDTICWAALDGIAVLVHGADKGLRSVMSGLAPKMPE